MKTPIPFLGWIEEDDLLEFLKQELNGNSSTYTFGRKRLQEIVEEMENLKQERDFYKDELERTNHATTKNNSPSSNQWRTNEFSSLEGESSKSPKDVEASKPQAV
jgi:hypothetical protein